MGSAVASLTAAPRLRSSKCRSRTVNLRIPGASAEWPDMSRATAGHRHQRHLPDTGLNDDLGYLYTLRYLLERLSWFARERNLVLEVTLAHVVRFKIEKLRTYEQILRADPTCQIAWAWLDEAGAKIDQPNRVELLQMGDLTASSIATAFEPDRFGNTEDRYLRELSPRLYRRKGNLTSYGLKLHPWSDSTRAAYPWVAAL